MNKFKWVRVQDVLINFAQIIEIDQRNFDKGFIEDFEGEIRLTNLDNVNLIILFKERFKRNKEFDKLQEILDYRKKNNIKYNVDEEITKIKIKDNLIDSIGVTHIVKTDLLKRDPYIYFYYSDRYPFKKGLKIFFKNKEERDKEFDKLEKQLLNEEN
jgi:hypothetical protein